jgi:hypothetical protein
MARRGRKIHCLNYFHWDECGAIVENGAKSGAKFAESAMRRMKE